ncbi:MAG: hypothetical protein ABJK39_06130 [Hyphomicrobiales bacterium]
MEYLTFLKIMHLIGLTAGLGGALYSDFLMVANGVLKRLEQQTLIEVKRLSKFVTYGLLLLWVSGAALAYEISLTKPEFLTNEKFWAKMVIVVVLTLNGVFVHYVVLNEVKRSIGKRLLIDSSIPMLVVLAVSGSVSFVSWMVPFILGKAPEFSYVVPMKNILTLWVIAINAALTGVLVLVALQNLWSRWSLPKLSAQKLNASV